MRFYLAPLEGITDYIYRRTYHRLFEPMDAYFIPFLTPNENGKFSVRQKKDLLPENNEGVHAIPQLLTNKEEEFLSGIRYLESLGYEEVNLNVGCPSKCVVSKGRGAGMLADTETLNAFLDRIFCESQIRISIKTRIGMQNPEEFEKILEIYHQYPVSELIIHPRTRNEYYKGFPHWEQYRYALQNSTIPICYNGDLFTKEQYDVWVEAFPESRAVMLGRGILGDPLLLSEIKGSDKNRCTWLELQYELYLAYKEEIAQEQHVLSRLKEFWTYRAMSHPEEKEMIQDIYRIRSLEEYAGFLSF